VNKPLIILVVVVSLFSLTLPVFASDSAEVTATVTPEQISVALYTGSPASVNYGTVPYRAVDRPPLTDPFIELVNNGTVRENFNVKGDDATASGEGSTWTLGSSPGNDVYVHKFGRGSSPSEFFALTKVAADNLIHGAAGVAVNSREGFKLRLSMPISASNQTDDQYTTTVTVVATAY